MRNEKTEWPMVYMAIAWVLFVIGFWLGMVVMQLQAEIREAQMKQHERIDK